MKTIAVYPGSFDPVTNGHVDLIQRSSALFDKVIVAILRNTSKTPLFSVDERKEMLELAVREFGNVAITDFSGLLVDFAEQVGASVIIRGVRAISDYEYELQMALINRRLLSRVETVFMLPAETYSFVSSRLIKEIASHGGTISGLVPEEVERRLRGRFTLNTSITENQKDTL
jgi:pantetheine-phosphate adenylyltransferase